MVHHGAYHHIVLSKEFFTSTDYRTLTGIGEKINQFSSSGIVIIQGESKKSAHTFEEAVNGLMVDAKRGQSIQRYKGLGEMNPDQLWETTMDPGTRSLLQVTIVDAIVADRLFTTLMGDEVESRRQFIEQNALEVENLDT